jgi:hypothetical protein
MNHYVEIAKSKINKLMPLTRELYTSGNLKQPNYILPMVLASAQAVCMGVERVASIEFGVASGRGLLALYTAKNRPDQKRL